MNVFDIMGIVSKVPYELEQKLIADMPKVQQLLALYQQAEPHINALLPIEKQAQALWDQLSPDVSAILKAVGAK